jgi:hypothetical protein
VQVTVSVPAAPAGPSTPGTEPATIVVRGPDGEVREFPVEGGRPALESRVIVVRPGKSATVTVMAGR